MPLSEESYNNRLETMVDELTTLDIASSEATTAMRNIVEFTKLQPPKPEPEPEPTAVASPPTKWQRFKCGTSAVWDNETTRVLIKAGGAFAGVALVVYSTIHRDHVVDRTALQQANQRPN